MKHNELPGIHRRIVHVCAEKQSAVKPRDAIGEKEEAALIAVSWTNTHISLPLPYRIEYPPKSQSFSYYELITVYFCLFYFSNSILHIFVTIIIIIGCLGMFQNVPGCSMFLVLWLILWPQTIQVVASYLHNPLLDKYYIPGSLKLLPRLSTEKLIESLLKL